MKTLRKQNRSVHALWIGAVLSLLVLLLSLQSTLADPAGTPIPGNLVVNGSFEQNQSPNQGPDAPVEVLFSPGNNPMPGWTQLNTICETEFWGHGAIRTAQDGHWLLELDALCNGKIQQIVPTVKDQQYRLRYYFAARPGTGPGTNALSVRVNGVQVKFFLTGHSTWQQFNHVITATGSTTTVSFEGAGANDGLGSLLDNVSLVADSDGDGVFDPDDLCSNTSEGLTVNQGGCALIKMTGGGHVDTGETDHSHSFGFNIKYVDANWVVNFQYNDNHAGMPNGKNPKKKNAPLQYHANTTALSADISYGYAGPDDDTLVVKVPCEKRKLDAAGNERISTVICTLNVGDKSEPGKGEDKFLLTTDEGPPGYTSNIAHSDVLIRGNIQAHYEEPDK